MIPDTLVEDMKKVMIILALIIVQLGVVHGNECSDSTFHADYENLIKLALSIQNEAAIEHADDLAKRLEKADLMNCELFFLTKLEKVFVLIKSTELVASQTLTLELLENPLINNHVHALAKAHILYALNFEWSGNGEMCFENLEKARKIIEEHGINELLPLYYVRSSSYNRIFGDKDLAFDQSKLAIKHGKEENDRRNTFDGYFLYSRLLGNIDTSIYYTKLNIENFLADNDILPAAIDMLNLSALYGEKGDVKLEKITLDSALRMVNSIDNRLPDFYLTSAVVMSDLQSFYERNGMIDSAYHYAKKSYELRGQFNFLDKKRTLVRNELRNKINLKDSALSQVNKDKKILQFGLALSALLSSIILILLLDLNRKRARIKVQNQEILETNSILKNSNQQNEMLLTEIHHRVKNNLQNVISLLYLKGSRNKNPEIQEVVADVTNKINSIAITHDQLYNSEEFDRLDFGVYIQNLLQNCTTIQSDQMHFTPPSEPLSLNLETIFPLGIIITELLTNSAKHNLAKTDLRVEIKVESQAGNYYLSYNDNGKGYPDDLTKANNIGLDLIKLLVRQLEGKLNLSNNPGAFAEIYFKEKIISKI